MLDDLDPRKCFTVRLVAVVMVAVPVRGDVMGDLGEAGLLRSRADASRVARAGIAGIDENRLARGRDDERRRAPLHVDQAGTVPAPLPGREGETACT